MSEYHDEKAARALESMAKSMIKIERQLEKQNKLLESLSGCVIDMGGGMKRLRINEH